MYESPGLKLTNLLANGALPYDIASCLNHQQALARDALRRYFADITDYIGRALRSGHTLAPVPLGLRGSFIESEAAARALEWQNWPADCRQVPVDHPYHDCWRSFQLWLRSNELTARLEDAPGLPGVKLVCIEPLQGTR